MQSTDEFFEGSRPPDGVCPDCMKVIPETLWRQHRRFIHGPEAKAAPVPATARVTTEVPGTEPPVGLSSRPPDGVCPDCGKVIPQSLWSMHRSRIHPPGKTPEKDGVGAAPEPTQIMQPLTSDPAVRAVRDSGSDGLTRLSPHDRELVAVWLVAEGEARSENPDPALLIDSCRAGIAAVEGASAAVDEGWLRWATGVTALNALLLDKGDVAARGAAAPFAEWSAATIARRGWTSDFWPQLRDMCLVVCRRHDEPLPTDPRPMPEDAAPAGGAVGSPALLESTGESIRAVDALLDLLRQLGLSDMPLIRCNDSLGSGFGIGYGGDSFAAVIVSARAPDFVYVSGGVLKEVGSHRAAAIELCNTMNDRRPEYSTFVEDDGLSADLLVQRAFHRELFTQVPSYFAGVIATAIQHVDAVRGFARQALGEAPPSYTWDDNDCHRLLTRTLR